MRLIVKMKHDKRVAVRNQLLEFQAGQEIELPYETACTLIRYNHADLVRPNADDAKANGYPVEGKP